MLYNGRNLALQFDRRERPKYRKLVPCSAPQENVRMVKHTIANAKHIRRGIIHPYIYDTGTSPWTCLLNLDTALEMISTDRTHGLLHNPNLRPILQLEGPRRHAHVIYSTKEQKRHHHITPPSVTTPSPRQYIIQGLLTILPRPFLSSPLKNKKTKTKKKET